MARSLRAMGIGGSAPARTGELPSPGNLSPIRSEMSARRARQSCRHLETFPRSVRKCQPAADGGDPLAHAYETIAKPVRFLHPLAVIGDDHSDLVMVFRGIMETVDRDRHEGRLRVPHGIAPRL